MLSTDIVRICHLDRRLPAYAHVPGKNERHPDAYFETITSAVSKELTIQELSQSVAFLFGFELFESEYYWEAHEVWEAVWLALPKGCDERRFVQALIQTANGYLKRRMGRLNATRRLCDIARDLYTACEKPELMGVEKEYMLDVLDKLERQI